MIQLSRVRLILLLVFAVIAGVLGTLAAAPITGQPALTDEQRSYADMWRLRVEVPPLPKELVAAGVRASDLHERVVEILTDAGVTVTEEIGDPKLSYKIGTMVDDRFPDVVGLAVVIDVMQRTRVLRLGDDLNLATSTYLLLNLRPHDEVISAVYRCVDEGTRRVVGFIDTASNIHTTSIRADPMPAPNSDD